MADEQKLAVSPEDRQAAKKAETKDTQNEGKPAERPAPAAAKAEKAEKASQTPAKGKAAGAKGKRAGKEKEKAEAPKREIILERRFSLTLLDSYAKPRPKRAANALKRLRALTARHMKSTPLAVKIDGTLARFAAGPGGRRPAKHVTVLAKKDKAGMVSAELAILKK